MDEHKIVHFDIYCKTCKCLEKDEHEEPCDDCLLTPTNINSHKPIKYKKRRKKNE